MRIDTGGAGAAERAPKDFGGGGAGARFAGGFGGGARGDDTAGAGAGAGAARSTEGLAAGGAGVVLPPSFSSLSRLSLSRSSASFSACFDFSSASFRSRSKRSSTVVSTEGEVGDDDGVTRDVRPLPRHRVLNFYRLDSPSAMNGNDSRVCFNAGTEEELARPGEQAVGLGLGIPRDECDGVTTRFLEGEDC